MTREELHKAAVELRGNEDEMLEFSYGLPTHEEFAVNFHLHQTKKMLEVFINAWESLPAGHNSIKATQKWIVDDLAPVFKDAKELLKQLKG